MPAPRNRTSSKKSYSAGGHCELRLRRAPILLVCTALLPLLLACAPSPLGDFNEIEGALDRARQAGAEEYAAVELRDAREALREARRSATLEDARLKFQRDYQHALFLEERARILALQALRLTRLRRDETQGLAEEEVRGLKDQLGRTQELKRYLMPQSQEVVTLLVGAGVDLEVAESRLGRGEFLEARTTARRGSSRVREAERYLLSNLVAYTNHPEMKSWTDWVDQVVSRSRSRGEVALVVDKLRRRLTVFRDGKKAQVYRVDLGLEGMSRKLQAGDEATPEGVYRVKEVRGPGQTKYHRAFLLNYPNRQDKKRFEKARRAGEISNKSHPGGLIEIHGEGGRNLDWTQGCVALANQEIDELASLVRVGTPVAIVGYDPRDEEAPW